MLLKETSITCNGSLIQKFLTVYVSNIAVFSVNRFISKKCFLSVSDYNRPLKFLYSNQLHCPYFLF